MCHRVIVMYLGKVVEVGGAAELFMAPRDPYARSFLAYVPRIGGRRVIEEVALEGEPPDPRDVPSGCRFRTRCPFARDRCAAAEPLLRRPCHFA